MYWNSNSNILAFIIGEVKRQGFDTETKRGADRIIYLGTAWDVAVMLSRRCSFPYLEDILQLGKIIEPEKNNGGFRTIPVTFRGEPLLPAVHIPRALEKLWESKEKYTTDEFYLEFEKIHPFVDGNGRTGKVLHNWISGTLEKPILVRDYFGHGVP